MVYLNPLCLFRSILPRVAFLHCIVNKIVIGHDNGDDRQALALCTSIENWLIPLVMGVLKPLRQLTTSDVLDHLRWTCQATSDGADAPKASQDCRGVKNELPLARMLSAKPCTLESL